MAATAAKAAAATKTAAASKVSLLIGVGIALAAANTRAAPLVVTILVAAVVYQLLNL